MNEISAVSRFEIYVDNKGIEFICFTPVMTADLQLYSS